MKSGLITFPLAVDLDDKMKLLEAEFHSKGFAVMIKIFQYIYSKGYYTKWDIDVGCLFTRERCPDVGWQLVSEIVACAIRREIFDVGMYNKYSILTSESIQETYLFATKRRNEVELTQEYLLPFSCNFIVNVNKSGKNVYKTNKNVYKNEQRIGKERIGKERIEDSAVACLRPFVEINCELELDEASYEKIAKEFALSDWLKVNIKTLTSVHRIKDKILQGYYRTSSQAKPATATTAFIKREYSEDELNAVYDRKNNEDF